VLETLTEKIQRQERLIHQLHADLSRARELSIHRVFGQLRLRGAVLLYVGHDEAKLLRDIDEEFGGDDASRDVSSALFVLDNAPVAPDVKDAIRKAVNGGMNRW
jgi:hypothetical protein